MLWALALAVSTYHASAWESDLPDARQVARDEGKMLFVSIGAHVRLAKVGFTVRDHADGFVFVSLPRDGRAESGDASAELMPPGEFEALAGKPGVAIIDYRNTGPHHGKVVSVLPAEQITSLVRVAKLLDLPDGSLTQRTLIWALRVHRQAPQSTAGEPDAKLMQHAESHSRRQARLNLQHHNLPDFATSEIVAESWPWNKCIVAAALDIVDAWSQSTGHWREASRPHRAYGYDMHTVGEKWFATGVFID